MRKNKIGRFFYKEVEKNIDDPFVMAQCVMIFISNVSAHHRHLLQRMT